MFTGAHEVKSGGRSSALTTAGFTVPRKLRAIFTRFLPVSPGFWSFYVLLLLLPSEVVLSPILVRPVREQLEHDRVIRLLQAKYKRKFEVAINPANEQTMPVGDGASPWFPDLVLQSADRGRRLQGIVEVETTESVNHLEAMSQWVTFSKFKAAFHLYVPTGCIDSTRRLCTDLNVNVAELWAYQSVGDQIRFTLVQRSAAAEQKARAAEAAEKAARAAAKPMVAAKPVAAKPVAARPAAKPAPARNGSAAAAKPAARPPARRVAPAAAVRRKTAAKAAKLAKPAPRRTVAAKAPARKAATPARSQKRR